MTQSHSKPSRTVSGALLPIALAVSLALAGCGSDSGDAAAHFEKAKQLQSAGDMQATVIELKNALQKDPELAEARSMLGYSYLKMGLGSAASKELEKARDLGSQDPGLKLALIRAQLLAGENKAVLDATEGSDDGETLALRAQAQLASGDTDGAHTTFTRALEKKADSVDAMLGLARISLSRKETDAAKAQMAKAIKVDPDHAEAMLMVAELAMLDNKPAEAEPMFAKAAAQPGRLELIAKLGLARALIAQEKLDEAEKSVDEVLAKAPNVPLANYLKGLVAFQRKNKDEARDFLLLALKADPNHAPSLLLNGSLAYEGKEYQQAEDALSRYVSAIPGHVPARKLLAATYSAQKRFADTIRTLEPVMEQTKDDAQILALLGNAYLRTGDPARGTNLLKKAVEAAPDQAGLRTQLALSQLASGETGAAQDQLKAAVELDPSMYQADSLLVLSLMRGQKFDEALEAAQRMSERMPDSPVPHNLMGASLLGKEDKDAARKQFEQALAVDAAFTPAAINLVKLDLGDKDSDSARKRLDAVLKQDPKNLDGLMISAALAEQDGDADKALTLVEQARDGHSGALQPRILLGQHYLRLRKVDEAAKVIGEALAIAPENGSVLALKGQLETSQGKPRQAISTFRKLVEQQPENAQAHLKLAQALIANGDDLQAREGLEKALELDEKLLPAMAAMATLESRGEEYATAMQWADKLVALAPDAITGYTLRGDILNAQKKYEAAIKAYQEAMGKAKSAQVLARLNRSLTLAGRPAEGKRLLEAWLKENPQDDATRLLLATSQQQSGDRRASARAYEDMLARHPNNVVVLNNLAWLYHEMGDSKALDLARKAQDIAPDSPAVTDTLGWLLVQSGQVEQGLSLLEKAASRAAGSGDIRYHYAFALNKSGDVGGARRELKGLLDDLKDFPERKNAQALLERLL